MNIKDFINKPIIITPLTYNYIEELTSYKPTTRYSDTICDSAIIKIINENKPATSRERVK